MMASVTENMVGSRMTSPNSDCQIAENVCRSKDLQLLIIDGDKN